MNTITSYEQWLALTDSERREIHRSWNVYSRENIGFAYTAAGHFAIGNNQIRIVDIRVGVFHGGEYILEFCVPDEDVTMLPTKLASEYAGFRIMFIAISQFYPQP